MNLNVASQHAGVLAFTGINAAAVSAPVDIRRHVHFAFTFQVIAALAADTIFNVQAAPPSDADPCLPGTFVDVPEVLTCTGIGTPLAHSHILIPAGTPIGSICTAALPCRPDAFIQVVPVSGDTADIRVVVTLSGPR
jgi:hypothetical protein